MAVGAIAIRNCVATTLGLLSLLSLGYYDRTLVLIIEHLY